MIVLSLVACDTAPAAPDETFVATRPVVVLAGEGLELRESRWRWAGRTGRVWTVRVGPVADLQVVPADGVVDFQTLLPSTAGSWAAINGGFYEDGRPMGLVVHDGVESAPLTARGGSGVVEMRDGAIRVVHRDAWTPGATEALQSVDRLVDQGASVVRARTGAPLAARSAIAVAEDAVWLVAMAEDGSVDVETEGVRLHDTSGRGVPLWVFSDFLVGALHAREALNLDGAISTQLDVQVAGRRWRVRGERGTVQAVVLRAP